MLKNRQRPWVAFHFTLFLHKCATLYSVADSRLGSQNHCMFVWKKKILTNSNMRNLTVRFWPHPSYLISWTFPSELCKAVKEHQNYANVKGSNKPLECISKEVGGKSVCLELYLKNYFLHLDYLLMSRYFTLFKQRTCLI